MRNNSLARFTASVVCTIRPSNTSWFLTSQMLQESIAKHTKLSPDPFNITPHHSSKKLCPLNLINIGRISWIAFHQKKKIILLGMIWRPRINVLCSWHIMRGINFSKLLAFTFPTRFNEVKHLQKHVSTRFYLLVYTNVHVL